MENFSRWFQLEIGDVIAKKGELPVGGLICHLTGESFSAKRSHLEADISNSETEKV
jgi:hypothetical protein